MLHKHNSFNHERLFQSFAQTTPIFKIYSLFQIGINNRLLAEKCCTILNKQMFAESKKHLQEADAEPSSA
jgi:hypothetical protein